VGFAHGKKKNVIIQQQSTYLACLRYWAQSFAHKEKEEEKKERTEEERKEGRKGGREERKKEDVKVCVVYKWMARYIHEYIIHI
jgi:hypothetical protein